MFFNLKTIALRKAKIVYNFGLSECNRIKGVGFANSVAPAEVAHKEPPHLDPHSLHSNL